MNTGNLDDAESSFEQALRVSPTNGKPYYYLGVVAFKQKDYQRSLSFLQQAETFLADSDFWMSQVYLQEGLALKALKKNAEAKDKFQNAVDRDSTNDAAKKQLQSTQ